MIALATVYATISDIETIRCTTLSTAEAAKAQSLLNAVSADIRLRGDGYGVNVDEKVSDSEDYAEVVKSVCVNTVNRALSQTSGTEGLSQISQTALGYTLHGTFANPGNAYYISKNDLLRLGFGKQYYRGRDIYGVSWNSDSTE